MRREADAGGVALVVRGGGAWGGVADAEIAKAGGDAGVGFRVIGARGVFGAAIVIAPWKVPSVLRIGLQALPGGAWLAAKPT